jgi:alpha-tubulin suppressor-like RCC1 family protein
MPSLTTLLRRILPVLVLVLAAASLTAPADASTARTLTAKATPSISRVRAVVTVSGVLSRSPRGSAVALQRRSGTQWETLWSTSTSTRAGAYSILVQLPRTPGTYVFRAIAPAQGALRAAVSPTFRIAALLRVSATIAASPTTVAPGGGSTLSGKVTPFVRGTTVTLQRQVGSSWATVTTARLNSVGRYAVTVHVASPTTYRVSVPRVTVRAPAVSAGVRVNTTGPVISTSALPDGNVGNAYSAHLTLATNVAGTWTAAPLPAGLSVDAATGAITGTPTTGGDTQVVLGFTETATGRHAAGKTLNLHVAAPVPPTISTTSLPNADQGVAYTTTLTATGNPTGTWTAAPLPTGLSVDAATGAITGTPTASGDTSVTIGFTQTNTGLSATPVQLTLHVNAPPPPVILTTSLPNGAALTAYSAQLYVAGNVAGAWTQTGLPSGMNINATSGLISGTPLLAATPTVHVTFTQTSTGLSTSRDYSLTIGIVGSTTTPAEVGAGGQFSCRIDTAQKLWCWGYDESGELGINGTVGDQPGQPSPHQVGTATDWSGLSTGASGLVTERHACALRGTDAYCWGADGSGELGYTTGTGFGTTPGLVGGGHHWLAVSAGWTSTCGVTTTGTLFCWGDNSLGQLGVVGPDTSAPQQVGVANTWTGVSVGYSAACATRGDGTLWCWGINARGQLGTGDRTDATTPVQVGTATDWTQVAVGSGYVCGLRGAGSLWCWGPSSNGELGNGVTLNDSTTDVLSPTQVGTATTWTDVATGSGTTCATNQAGQLWCWGANGLGQVGDGTTAVRSTPTQVGTATSWVTVSMGDSHACGTRTAGTQFCWGNNSKGELGTGSLSPASSPTPVQVS